VLELELIPTLSQCIETIAKDEYKETVQKLLSTEKVSHKLKEKAEILSLFLQVADFRKLRAESEEYILQGRNVSFIVYLESGTIKYDMRIQM